MLESLGFRVQGSYKASSWPGGFRSCKKIPRIMREFYKTFLLGVAILMTQALLFKAPVNAHIKQI